MGRIFRYPVFFAFTLSLQAISAPTHLVNEEPISIEEVKPGLFLVDFGRVAFGNLSLTAIKNKRTKATVRFGEALEDGRIDRSPPGTVRYEKAKTRLTAGEPVIVAPRKDKRNTSTGNSNTPPAILTPEEWGVLVPFRWVEISGFSGELDKTQITRRAAYLRDWDDGAAQFESSDPLLNQVWELSRYSIKATSFAGVYIDGDRERIPYEGDAYLNQLSHYYTDYDRQMARDTFDHLMRHPTWPTEWASHMIFMAHEDWMHTGNRQWLAQRYEALKDKLLLERARNDGLVASNEKQIDKGDLVDWPIGERDDYVLSPINTVVNAFHLKSIKMMADMAIALENEGDAKHYEAIYQRALTAFQTKLYSPSDGLFLDGENVRHSSLHANLFPLAFGLVPEENRHSIAVWLAAKGMRCSVYAAQYLLQALLENGFGKEALQLITAKGDRSWRHMLDSGATVTWEAWDVKYKPNLDWNHAWGAAPANLLPRYVLGVEPLAAGWKTARIRPTPGDLASARGTIPTVQGPIHIDWSNDDTFKLNLNLPSGVRGQIELPALQGSTGISIDGKRAIADKVGELWILKEPVEGSVSVEVMK
ncbi:MAG: family 78 glycoside hydrolase catalytic domain [Halioglobus sp.]